ncbi:MAG: preprotein translocase subunit SecG [Clostridia bacterium]|nr:preprotein translocase subunit SecG [Clostridia bacterium]MBR4186071.1 preprotein translocase subunit SecG [Clostridia bacterium]
MEIAIGILLILAAIFLVVAVLMQSGKSHNLSGTIAGGAETFFGKSKATTLDKKLSKLTTIVAIVFVLLVLASYFMQDTVDIRSLAASTPAVSTETADDTAGAVLDSAEEAAENAEDGGND